MIVIDSIFFAIVSRGKANAALRKAEECGAKGGTIFLAEGTVQSKLLEQLGFTEIHKEILMISASEELSDKLHDEIGKALLLSKRNNGIAFTIPFKRHSLQNDGEQPEETTGVDDASHYCIITIVDKGGRSKKCVQAARAAGARGGTLIRGRGAGVPTDFYFPLVIEPQKDVVLIITTKDKVSAIRERIFLDLELNRVGNGILFTLPVSRASGLYENRTEAKVEVTP